jgi:hypothetical protein
VDHVVNADHPVHVRTGALRINRDIQTIQLTSGLSDVAVNELPRLAGLAARLEEDARFDGGCRYGKRAVFGRCLVTDRIRHHNALLGR